MLPLTVIVTVARPPSTGWGVSAIAPADIADMRTIGTGVGGRSPPLTLTSRMV